MSYTKSVMASDLSGGWSTFSYLARVCLTIGLGVSALGTVPSANAAPATAGALVRVSVAESRGLYTYSYEVVNPGASSGSVSQLSLDISQPIGGMSLSGDGLHSGAGYEAEISRAVLLDLPSVKMIPVGLTAPQGWTVALGVDGTVAWFTTGNMKVDPGETLRGFVLESRGLPGIRRVTIEPSIDVSDLGITPPSGPEDLDRYKADLDVAQRKLSMVGVAVGPSAPPIDFRAADFLRMIVSYKEHAVQLNWINDRGVGISLDAKLQAAEAALSRGQSRTAISILNALVHEVDAQAGKQLSTEVVALLKYNTQYLISKL